MKTEYEINKILQKLDIIKPSEYPNMSYEQGVEETLMWIIGDISDDEFSIYED